MHVHLSLIVPPVVVPALIARPDCASAVGSIGAAHSV